MDGGLRERWDRRWSGGRHSDGEPPDWLDEVEEFGAVQGRALDIASGSGRVALWLARRGLEVAATDVSPVGLAQCLDAAREEGLTVVGHEIDLEAGSLPEGPWDLITCFHYLQRGLFPQLRDVLAPAGLLVIEIATRRNLERHERPGDRFLLEPGELYDLLAPLKPVFYREGWFEDHHVARAVSRRPSHEE